MKIVKIIGGLGNQMFQFALFTALKNKYPNEVILTDSSYFKTYKVHNGLELQKVFGISLPQASFKQLLKVTYPSNSYKLSRFFRKFIKKRKSECIEYPDYTFNHNVFTEGSKYYDGYWQNFKYFEEVSNQLKDIFQFKLTLNSRSNFLLSELGNLNNSVSIHVRRGDYLQAPNYAGLCGLEYYSKAITYIKNKIDNPQFYIFSDDINWCKNNIEPLLNTNKITFVDWNKGEESALDMLLMSKCNNNIIANSSFSWWAAFLNTYENKIVCAPEKWTNTKVNCKFQLPSWKLF